jgi:predicted small metal-binding protein
LVCLTGTNEDEIVKNAQDHAKDKHAVIVTAEQALALAQEE